MPDYKVTNGFIIQKGRIYRPGMTVTLSEEKAALLGDNIVPIEVVGKDFQTLKVKELRPLAKAANIDGYSTMDKSELIEALEAVQPPEEVVTDESDSDS